MCSTGSAIGGSSLFCNEADVKRLRLLQLVHRAFYRETVSVCQTASCPSSVSYQRRVSFEFHAGATLVLLFVGEGGTVSQAAVFIIFHIKPVDVSQLDF